MGTMMPGMPHEMQQQARRRILLRIDGLQLMLPEGEACAVESVMDIIQHEADAPAIGHIAYAGKNWPVLCLNGELEALDCVAPGRRACVMLNTGHGFLGLLCDDVRVLKQLNAVSHVLPAAMRSVSTPILALMQFESGLACLSDMQHLMQFGAMEQVLQGNTAYAKLPQQGFQFRKTPLQGQSVTSAGNIVPAALIAPVATSIL